MSRFIEIFLWCAMLFVAALNGVVGRELTAIFILLLVLASVAVRAYLEWTEDRQP